MQSLERTVEKLPPAAAQSNGALLTREAICILNLAPALTPASSGGCLISLARLAMAAVVLAKRGPSRLPGVHTRLMQS